MRLTVLAAALIAMSTPLPAPAAQMLPVQSDRAPDAQLPDEIERAFREMMDRLRPALDDLLETMRVFKDIDSIENYEAPEVLPNGDILIRRRGDAPPWPPEESPPEAAPPAKAEPPGGVKT